MKKTPLRRKSKSDIKKIQDKIWQECRRIVFEQFGDTCYTCGAKHLTGANRQCGHLYPKASVGAYLKYDLRILRPQCFHCNINLAGNGAVFYKKMLKIEGQAYMDKIEDDKKIIVKASDFYPKLLEEYKDIRL